MTAVQLSTKTLGAGLMVFGILLVWVRFAHDRNRVARAIYRVYEKTSLVPIPLDLYFLVGGIGLVVLGSLLLTGSIG